MLATVFYFLSLEQGFFETSGPLWRAFWIGLSYNLVIDANVVTLKVGEDRELKLGPGLIYTPVKFLVYKQIEERAKAQRRPATVSQSQKQFEEAKSLSERNSLKDLIKQAQLLIESQEYRSDSQKKEDAKYLIDIINDNNSTYMDKKEYIAIFINTGKKIGSIGNPVES